MSKRRKLISELPVVGRREKPISAVSQKTHKVRKEQEKEIFQVQWLRFVNNWLEV